MSGPSWLDSRPPSGLIVTEGLQTFKQNEAAMIISCSRTFDPTFTSWKKIGNFPGNSPL
jgi:hypothetical protein